MKLNYTFYTVIITLSLLVTSCKSDTAGNQDNNSTETVDSHAGHDHAGHDHSAHDGHDHSEVSSDKNEDRFAGKSEDEILKMKAIERAQAQGLINKTSNGVDISQRGIPNPCKLVSVDWLMKNTSFGITKDASIKSGTKVSDSDNRSCFFQWEYEGDPNAGFLINVMVNPVPEEITDFPETYMLAKKMDGESMVGKDKPFPYKKIDNLGTEALGCYELGKYYWRQDNDYLFMMAFNMNISEDAQKNAFVKIAKEVQKNFNASLK